MMYSDAAYFGMHMFWWMFWIIVCVSFFSFLTPVPRSRWQRTRETAHDILKRRFASWEVSEQEYESRKAILDRDMRRDTTSAKDLKRDQNNPSHA